MQTPKAFGWLLAVSIFMATTLSVQGATLVPGVSAGSDSAPSEEVQVPENLTREEVRDLLSRLSDDQVRTLLIRELDKEAVDSGAGASGNDEDTITQFHDAVETTRLRLGGILASWPKFVRAPGHVWAQATMAGTVSSWSVVLWLVLMFAVGWAAEKLFRRSTGIERAANELPTLEGLFARLGASLVRALIRFMVLLVYAVAAFIVMCMAVWSNDGAEPLFIMFLSAVLIIRSLAILLDVVLAPRAPGLRLVGLSDNGARALRDRLLVLVSLLIVQRIVIQAMDMYGVDAHATTLLGLVIAVLFVVAVIAMIWEARRPYAALIRGDDADQVTGEPGFVDMLATYWHLVAIAAVLVLFVISLSNVGVAGSEARYSGVKSLTLLMLLPIIDLCLRRIVARLFTFVDEDSLGSAGTDQSMMTLAPANEADNALRKTASREVQAVVLKNLRIVLGFIAVLVILGFYGIGVGSMAESVAGERIGGAFFDVVITAFIAYAIWSVVKAAVSFHLGPEEDVAEGGGEAGGSEIGGAGQTRMQTLLPLFRKIIFFTLLIMGVLIVLSSLGVNIGPLIAGAGVLGLAIGFGAQALVRDIVSGIFFLLDDAFRMGEYVAIGDVKGSVEGISVRSLRLRHHNGPLHTVPFGEIKHLTNYSRDWAIMKFELRLPFETNINKVRKIIKTVGLEMAEDEELAPLMLETLKSQGVNRMEDSALIIRCKFTAIPGQQFYVRREAFTRIQAAFEENGIRFAPKRVIVESASPAIAVAGAAALESEDPLAPGAGAGKADDRG